MANIEISLPNGILMREVSKHTNAFAALYKEIAGEIAGSANATPELMMSSHRKGSLVMVAEPVLGEHGDAEAAEASKEVMLDGLEALNNGRAPLGYTPKAIEHASDLVGRFTNEDSAVYVRSGDREVRCGNRMRNQARALLNRRSTTWGTVEGTVETLSTHGKDYFNLYELLTNDRIECRFPRSMMEVVSKSWDRRVVVSGLIHSRGGRIEFVRVEDLRVRPSDSELPSFSDMWGLLADGD